MKFSLKGLKGTERGLAKGVNATWSVLPKSIQTAIRRNYMRVDSQHIALAREHIDAIRAYYEYCGWTYTPPQWAYRSVVTHGTGGPLRISSSSSDPNKKEYEITFKGTKEEVEKIEAALTSGSQWVRGANGEHNFAPAYLDAPEPINDPLISEQWPTEPDRKWRPLKSIGEGRETPPDQFSAKYRNIYIHHIGGYGGGISYKERVRTLESWGFNCLRSRRGDNGKIWECWFLGGMLLAKGDLKGTPVKDVVNKIFRQVNPGVLEFAGERWYLTID